MKEPKSVTKSVTKSTTKSTTKSVTKSAIDHILDLVIYIAGEFTSLSQMIVSFAFGVLLSPLSFGLLWYLLFIFTYEILYFCTTHHEYWNFYTRAAVIITAIFGWIVGRSVRGVTIIDEDSEDSDNNNDYGVFWRKWK